jgi:MFS family permease
VAAKDAASQAGGATLRATRRASRRVRGEIVKRVGGPARARVVVLFGATLALNGADTATVGAVAPQLEKALHIGNTKIGLLSAVALLVGAVFTIPVGMLVDRIKRVPMLSVSILLWSVASLLSAFAGSYSGLLFTRVLLGAVTATAGPAIASLTGDYFPARERGRVYAYILGGEIAGTAAGFIISGSVASLISWRAAFLLLAIPGFFLARELYRTVPEPLRGGQSRLEPGVVDLDEAVAESASRPPAAAGTEQADDEPAAADDLAQEAVRQKGVEPDPKLVLKEDPRSLPIVDAVRYILAIPTNLLLIISSSLGYFFFSGLSTFALLFVRGHYHASQAEAELVLALLVVGAMAGTLVSGRVTDSLLRQGNLEVRIWVPAVCYLGAAALLVPGIVVRRRGSSAAVGGQSAARRGPPGHHARRALGSRREHEDGAALARPGVGAARLWRPRGSDRGHRSGAVADRDTSGRDLAGGRARPRDLLPAVAQHRRCRGDRAAASARDVPA